MENLLTTAMISSAPEAIKVRVRGRIPFGGRVAMVTGRKIEYIR